MRALCVISAGFAEVGAEGAARQEQLLALVRSYGGRMIGPNCLGVASTPALLNATFAASALPPGSVGFASQSGALGLAAVEQARGRGLGLSSFVSLGNKADVSSNDLLEYWEDDDGTNVVALYLESFGNPERFSRIARRVARRKPVLALKGGVSAAGARAAASHTAALASSEAAVEALFHQAGVQRMRTLSELLDAAALLSSQPLPAGPRVAVLTNAGGLGILCADACEAEGLQLPEPSDATRDRLAAVVPAEASLRNPIDLLGSATGTTFAAALGPLLDDPEVDSICVLFVRPAIARTEDVAKAVDAALAAAGDHGKTVTGVFLSAEPLIGGRLPSRLATFSSPEAAARALGVGARRAAWLRRPEGRVPALGGIDRATARAVARAALNGVDDAWLGADASRRLLEAYGIRLVGEALADDPEAAVTAASELGFPVVVKTAEPEPTRPRAAGWCSICATRPRCARGRGPHRRRGAGAVDERGRRTAGRRGSRPHLRPDRGARPRWSAGRARGRRDLPHRSAHGSRRSRAGRGASRQAPRRRLPRPPATRRGRPPRPAASSLRSARRTCPRSPSSISTRCSRAPTGTWPSTGGCASGGSIRTFAQRPGEGS